MKKRIIKIKDLFEDKLKGWCGEISPDQRLIIIVCMLLVFSIINMYIMLTSIYNLGKKNSEKTEIRIEHIEQAPIQFSK